MKKILLLVLSLTLLNSLPSWGQTNKTELKATKSSLNKKAVVEIVAGIGVSSYGLHAKISQDFLLYTQYESQGSNFIRTLSDGEIKKLGLNRRILAKWGAHIGVVSLVVGTGLAFKGILDMDKASNLPNAKARFSSERSTNPKLDLQRSISSSDQKKLSMKASHN